jgi:hypothetical protein
MPDAQPTPPRFRFRTIEDVAEGLATSPAQIRALIKRRELRALQIGGRGQWWVERAKLGGFIGLVGRLSGGPWEGHRGPIDRDAARDHLWA